MASSACLAKRGSSGTSTCHLSRLGEASWKTRLQMPRVLEEKDNQIEILVSTRPAWIRKKRHECAESLLSV